MNGITRQWWRLGGMFGIAFIVVFIVAIVVQSTTAGEPPSYDDPVADIRAYWADDGDAYLASDYLFAIAHFVLLLPFLAALRALLGAAEGGGQMFSRTAMLAGLLAIAITAGATASWGTLAFAADELDDSVLTTLMYVDIVAWSLVPMPYGVLLLAASIVILTTGVVWRWLGILGVVVGICALISPLWLVDGDEDGPLGILGFAAFLGLAIWLLLTSIAMVIRKEAPQSVIQTLD